MKKIIIAMLVVFLGIANIYSKTSINDFFSDSITKNIQDLEKIYRFSEENFLYEVDHKKVYEAMASAMLKAFDDEWTRYITSEESKDFQEGIEGRYGGIGVYVSKKTPSDDLDTDDENNIYLQISGCITGGPAQKAGLKSHDLITHINGESVIGKTAMECSNLLKGEAGTTVNITVKRGNASFNVQLKREEIDLPNVESEMLEGNMLYLRINSFTYITAEQIRNEIKKYQTPSALIIDLRNNGGGDVDNCIEVADLFLGEGRTIIKTQSKILRRNKTFYSTAGTLLPNTTKIAVLINEGTASASEILSLSLKENGRAVLVGQKTYGKGVMQVTTPFKDGIINVTTAEYISGNGTHVHKVGIEPDYYVEPESLKEEDEIKAFIELETSGDLAAFVDKNPIFGKYSIDKGVQELSKKYNLPEFSLKAALLAEYNDRLEDDERHKAFPEYDSALAKAIEILKNR